MDIYAKYNSNTFSRDSFNKIILAQLEKQFDFHLTSNIEDKEVWFVDVIDSALLRSYMVHDNNHTSSSWMGSKFHGHNFSLSDVFLLAETQVKGNHFFYVSPLSEQLAESKYSISFSKNLKKLIKESSDIYGLQVSLKNHPIKLFKLYFD